MKVNLLRHWRNASVFFVLQIRKIYKLSNRKIRKIYKFSNRSKFAKFTASIIGTFHYIVPERRTCRFRMKRLLKGETKRKYCREIYR